MRSTVNAFNRRQFLRGRFRKKAENIRPPWALPENNFTNTCTRCGECIDKCPEKIIVKGEDGFPTINFNLGACTFCEICVMACEPGALSMNNSTPPWNLRANISNDCLSLKGVACRSCADSCEQEAISFQTKPGGISEPATDSSCIGCGSCVAICPVKAITVSEKKIHEETDYEHN